MDLDTQTSDDEHLEAIPWSQLMVEAKSDRPLLIYVAAAALLALAVGVAVARGLGRSTVAEPAPVVSTPVAKEEPATPDPISEADLRAPLAPTGVGAGAVIARAEWFVADYFTLDGAGDRLSALQEALGWRPPAMPGGPTTYVEWARAWDSVELGDGRYRVLVAYRAISSLDGVFTRGPARAVAVIIQLGVDGGTRVVDLPEPVQIPPGPASTVIAASDPVPDEIAELARDLARSWSDDVAVVGGSEHEEAWRVVVEVDVASGRWPMLVWVGK